MSQKQQRRKARMERKGHSHVREMGQKGCGMALLTHYMERVVTPRKALSPELRSKALVLWRYIDLESPKPFSTQEEYLEYLETDLVPQARIFYWECVILSCFDVFNFGLTFSASAPVWGLHLDFEAWKASQDVIKNTIQMPVPTLEGLAGEDDFADWNQLPKDYRHNVFVAVQAVSTNEKGWDRERSARTVFLRKALVALIRVTFRRRKEFAGILNKKHERIGTHLGAMCAQCYKKNANCKLCSACNVVYYCNSACQRSHWPTHKKECATIKKVTQNDSGASSSEPDNELVFMFVRET